MAFLVKSDSRSARGLKFALLALLALPVAGCLVFEQLGWSFSGPTFSHKSHVEGQEL